MNLIKEKIDNCERIKCDMFRPSHFWFLVFCHFWQRSYENMKISCNLCLHFGSQDGQDRRKRKENHATKVTKIPNTKKQKLGLTKQ